MSESTVTMVCIRISSIYHYDRETLEILCIDEFSINWNLNFIFQVLKSGSSLSVTPKRSEKGRPNIDCATSATSPRNHTNVLVNWESCLHWQGLEIPATEPAHTDSDNWDCGSEQPLRSVHNLKPQSQARKAKVGDSSKSNAAASDGRRESRSAAAWIQMLISWPMNSDMYLKNIVKLYLKSCAPKFQMAAVLAACTNSTGTLCSC